MEPEENNRFDIVHVRSSTIPSFFSIDSSVSEMGTENFYDLCKNSLKVSPRNQTLLNKIK